MSVIAHNLAVDLGGKPILRDIDFSASAGELTMIVGPNGSGKTTLMRALTGELPFSGRAEIAGVDLASAKPWQLAGRRAVLPQSSSLAFPFTVYEVVRMGLIAGAHADDQRLPSRALSAVGLDSYEGRLFQELSGGEQQRVHLARVLSQVWQPVTESQCCWLFLDEPVSSLDIAHQLQVMSITAGYASQGGGVIAVMHDLNLTLTYADRVILMHEGRVRASGTPTDVMTEAMLSDVYGCPLRVRTVPGEQQSYVLPGSRK
ncbi:MAG: heme ABC transporter ATP-binding protein [Pseudomonadota bacterium]